MTNDSGAKYRSAFLILGVLFVIWRIVGLIDQRSVAYSGFVTDGNNTIIRIDAGSPAERAGLKVGDYIKSIGGISVEDTAAFARRGRNTIGETEAYVADRRGETVPGATGEVPASITANVTYAGSPGRYVALGYTASLIGFCFIICGLAAYFKVPSRSAALLAMTGLCLGVTFGGGPYFSSYFVRTLVASIQMVLAVLGFGFLLHFMLNFPKPKAFLNKKHALRFIYGPAVFIAIYLLLLIIVQPRATSGLNQVSNILVGLFIVVYFGWATIAMIHTYAKATSQERFDYGLNMMLAGVIVGFLPVTIAALVGIFAPKLVLPGSDFYFLTLILIPIALAWAVLHQKTAAKVASAQA